MPKNSVLEWDATAANNTDIAGINIQGSAAVSNFDNALRTVMAQVKSGLDYKQVYSVKTGNYTALTTDNNAFFRFTATATLSFTACATLGANWHCIVVADGGAVTLDPNAAELIDGQASLVIPNGSSCYVICDGTGLKTAFGYPISAVDVASATTTNIGAVSTENIRITGAIAITSFGTAPAGVFKRLLFISTPTLTHSDPTLILPGNANIVAVAGDVAEFVSEGSGNWRCVNYLRRQSLPYVTTNIVGTVAQTAGIPTAAIIETGTNANGTYTRYADGTQICTKSFSAGTVTFSASGSVFISAAINPGSFAAAFSAAPVAVSPSVLSSTGLVWAAMATAASTTAWPQFYAFSSLVTSSTGTTLSLVAVGRWF